jgi:Tol biopolymer transport system component
MRLRIMARPILTAVLYSAAAAAPASAQYFGKNKVQYKHLQFQTLRTEHFDIYFARSDSVAIDGAARMAERWHERLSRIFLHRLMDRQPLILYNSHPEFEQTNVVPDLLDEATGGLTEPAGRRIVLPLAGPLADTDHVIGHELVHAFQFDMIAGIGGTGGLQRLPLWFVEGLAEYCSLGPADAATAMWLRDAARRNALPSIDDLDDPALFPYRWGHAFWAYVTGRWGDGVIRRLFMVAAESGIRAATQTVLGRSTQALSLEWQAAIRDAYAPVLASTSSPDAVRLPLGAIPGRSELNVGPAISPDGRQIAFLSGRGMFSVDLYVADASTGRIARKLTNTSASAHFSSLQFVHSSGAWDSDGRRLAVAAVTGGRAALAIFDTRTWRQEREIVMPGVDEIFGPSWAPDDRRLCFTGMSRGITDLYVYDLRDSSLRRVTADAFADLHPAWSPDGRWIAFATDRFTTRLDTVAAGRYQLAVLDLTSDTIQPFRPSAAGDDVNPQWRPDGRAIYFVSNRTGIANVYRAAFDGNTDVEQLTDVTTGVNGITGTSPAMSIATRSGVVSFSVYENGGYATYVLDPEKRAPVVAAARTTTMLPPVDRKPSEIAAYVNNAMFGLPKIGTHTVNRHTPTLSLEGVGGAFIAGGVDPFGAAANGAATFSFADILGDRHLGTAVRMSNGLTRTVSVDDVAAQVAYLDQSRRWSWGAAMGQLPFISGGVRLEANATSAHGPVAVSQTILLRRLDRSMAGVAAYPFNRAARLEFAGSLGSFSFDRITETIVTSLWTAETLEARTEVTSLAAPLVIGTGSAAVVFDTSDFGATSPVRGQRYRVEAAPTVGTLDFTSVLADYRRYLMPAPFYTIALRVLHHGRYGSGAEDIRLLPSYLGDPGLVRGYEIVPFDLGDCALNGTTPCAPPSPLMGSRVLVANVEFRMPLLRPLGITRRMYGPVPTELAVFADGGAAWNRGERPSLFGGARTPAASAGFTLRTNVRGLAVAAFTVARPLHRQDRDWVFQFNLAPGF